jgi:hypothetical protein
MNMELPYVKTITITILNTTKMIRIRFGTPFPQRETKMREKEEEM